MATVNPSELSRFYYSADGTTYSLVALCNNIDGIGEQLEEREITSLGDTNVVRRFSHIPDFNEVTVSGFYDPADAQHTKLTTVDRSELYWKATVSDGGDTPVVYNFTFEGVVTSYSIGDLTTDGDGVSFEATIRRTTAITKALVA